MNTEILKGPIFQTAVKEYLNAAFWCQCLTDEEDEMVENLDDKYVHEDCTDETLAFIAGECLKGLIKLNKVVPVEELDLDAIEAIFFALGGQASGAGIRLTDSPIDGLSHEQADEIADWYDKEWGVRTLSMYPGDDGKVYIEGYEREHDFTLQIDGAEEIITIRGMAVSLAALMLEYLVTR